MRALLGISRVRLAVLAIGGTIAAIIVSISGGQTTQWRKTVVLDAEPVRNVSLELNGSLAGHRVHDATEPGTETGAESTFAAFEATEIPIKP